MTKPSNSFLIDILFVLILAAVLGSIYSLGLDNELIFDDIYQLKERIPLEYGNLLQFKPRLLSYGSFVWLDMFSGGGLVWQRCLNVALHMATCLALYKLFLTLIPRIDVFGMDGKSVRVNSPPIDAVRLGVLLFAANPMAVYATGYLVQRSILMATLFSILSIWMFSKSLIENKVSWIVPAVFFYLLAVASKEHAFLLPIALIPLYIFIARPAPKALLAVSLPSLVIVLTVFTILLNLYPNTVGQIFDGASRELTMQLDAQRPGLSGDVYRLSILNEAALFFYYGFLWFLPFPGWMSVDMHPAFPLSVWSFPHLFGAVCYLLLFFGSAFAVLRRSDVFGFVGACLLIPLILFWTEFSTVWVQDPFVLYRSYLWAIPIPGLIAVVFLNFSGRAVYKIAVVFTIAFSFGAAERVLSLRNELTLWSDVVEKTDLPGVPNSVGRSRAFMNRGTENLKRSNFELALKDFSTALVLGESGGKAWFAIGQTRQSLGQHADALEAFRKSDANGYAGKLLHFHRGQSLFAMQLWEDAIVEYREAMRLGLPEALAQVASANTADAALRLGRYSDAISIFRKILQKQPGDPKSMAGLGLAQLGDKDPSGALQTFDSLVAVKPDALAHYGRALAYYHLGKRAFALREIEISIAKEPGNFAYRRVWEGITNGSSLSF